MGGRTAPKHDSVPIEGLGFGMTSTVVLRRAGIKTVGMLRDVLDGNEKGCRILDAHKTHKAFLESPGTRNDLRVQLAAFDKNGPMPFVTLTRLETQILNLVVEGLSNKAISAQLSIAEPGVSARLPSLIRKLKHRFAPYDA
jgi:DNA-binding NarL/FixJ family response regulator